MWLARPIYEFLPYLYMLIGVLLLGAAWLSDALPGIFMGLGVLSLLGGLVVWLRRRDYRTSQAEYDGRSLDE